MKKWRSRFLIGLVTIAVAAVVWGVASGQFLSRDQKMTRQFQKIQACVQPGELQSWATNLLSTGARGVVHGVPDFVWRGHSDAPPFAFVPYPGHAPSVWLAFGHGGSDNFFLLIGHTNFTLPRTNPTNRNYCVEWIPGVYFAYERLARVD